MVSFKSKNVTTTNPRKPSNKMEDSQTRNRLHHKTTPQHDKKKKQNHRIQMRLRLRILTAKIDNTTSKKTNNYRKTMLITINNT